MMMDQGKVAYSVKLNNTISILKIWYICSICEAIARLHVVCSLQVSWSCFLMQTKHH